MTRSYSVALSLAGLILAAAGASAAELYPSKPIRIVTSEVGNTQDWTSRVLSQGLTESLGQRVVVENRPSGVIPGNIVAKAAADGYTLLVCGNLLWIGPLMDGNTPYDPIKDFVPITLVASSPNVLVVYPQLPVKSVKELIALAKAKPGELNYGSSGLGASPHLAAELFKSMAGVNMVRVAYRGSGPALIALVAGQIHLMFPNAGAAALHVQSGRLRALGVASAQPTALTPGLPTIAASGVPGYEAVATIAALAPAKTPADIVKRLNQEIARVVGTKDVKEKFFSAGVDVVASTPEQLAAAMKLDVARLGKVIRDGGIRAE